MSRHTVDGTPPATITDLGASSPTANSITLTWTAPGDNGISGTATGYIVKYSTTGPITESNWASATTCAQSWTLQGAGSIESHTISGLATNTSYWFAVRAYDEVPNYGGVSNSPSATTTGGGSAVEFPIGLVTLGVIGAVAGVLVAVVVKTKMPKKGL